MRSTILLLSALIFFSCAKHVEKTSSFYNGDISLKLPDNWKTIKEASLRFDSDDLLYGEFVGDSLTTSGVRIEVYKSALVGNELDDIIVNQQEMQKVRNVTTMITTTGKRTINGKVFGWFQYTAELKHKKNQELVLLCLENKQLFKFTITVVNMSFEEFEAISNNIANSIVLRD